MLSRLVGNSPSAIATARANQLACPPEDAARGNAGTVFTGSLTADGSAYPKLAVAWFALGVIVLVQIISTIDRGILALLVDPVRHDLRISEVQMGLLQGPAFSIFYIAAGLPLGLIADVVSRQRLLLVGLLAWSLATIAGGFAHTFHTLFLTRILVGVGEATFGPCAVSMISDMFPTNRRSWPMSLFLLGGAISSGMAALIIGTVLTVGSSRGAAGFPLVGVLAPWRMAFVVCGALGLFTSVVFLLVKEPMRQGRRIGRATALGVGEATAYFRTNWRVFIPHFSGVGFFMLATSSLQAWGPSLIIRKFALPPGSVGRELGLFNMASAVIGSMAAGLLMSAAVRKSGLAGKLALAPVIPLLGLPATMAVLAPTANGAMLTIAEMMMVMPLFGTVLLSATVELVPADMRGLSVSLYSFIGSILGITSGPLLVAAISQHVFHDPAKVGFALMLVAGPGLVLSAVALLWSRSNMRLAAAREGHFADVWRDGRPI